MTKADFVALVMSKPAIRGLKRVAVVGNALVQEDYPIADLQKAVELEVDISVDECAHQDFDFTCDVTDFPGGSLANVSEYKLEGKKQDARDIINIRYGATLKLLNSIDDTTLDSLYPDRSLLTVVKYWIRTARQNDKPVVELAGSPISSGDTIRYRYRKNNLSCEQWPKGWEGVIVDNIIKKFVPGYAKTAEASFNNMVSSYQGSNAESDPASLDQSTRQRFQNMNSLHGY